MIKFGSTTEDSEAVTKNLAHNQEEMMLFTLIK